MIENTEDGTTPMQTQQLIRTLTLDLAPVRPLASAPLRAARWLAGAAVLSALVVALTTGTHVFAARISVPRIACQCVGEALTAVAAVLAAFMRSVPGRSAHWAWLPAPFFALWLGASGAGCLANGWSLHGPGGFIGESSHCFAFIIAASIPLAAALFVALRRARPIDPLPVATLGMLGVAAAAAFVLEFFHPFDVTVIDLGLHLAAVGVVIACGVALRRRVLAPA